MKKIKKMMVCLLAITLLCSSQLTYVSAATAPGEEVMPLSFDQPVTNTKTKGSYEIEFTVLFNYADGISVKYVGYSLSVLKGSKPTEVEVKGVSQSYSGDYLVITAIVSTPDGNLTFEARCDQYGQTGHN